MFFIRPLAQASSPTPASPATRLHGALMQLLAPKPMARHPARPAPKPALAQHHRATPRWRAIVLFILCALGAGTSLAAPTDATDDPRPHSSQCDMPLRVAQVDLDYVYDTDPRQMQRNANLLIERIKAMPVNTVFLQAFADPLGDGLARSLYFPNRWLPMRANLFGTVTQRLQNEAGVQVYAWMPVLSFDLDEKLERVTAWRADDLEQTPQPARNAYRRLSPFDATARQRIGELYEDLARSADFDGLLFHDDAVLSDFEDASAAAQTAYQEQGLPVTGHALRNDADTWHHWTRFKSETLNVLTIELRDKVQAIEGKPVKTARNLFALPVIQPESEAWFAQNLADFLALYDWTAIMAMPLMEGIPAAQSTQWLAQLADRVAQQPGTRERTLFELQTRDWSAPGQAAVSTSMLTLWIQTLRRHGACHIGYYPDDFHQNQPDAAALGQVLAE